MESTYSWNTMTLFTFIKNINIWTDNNDIQQIIDKVKRTYGNSNHTLLGAETWRMTKRSKDIFRSKLIDLTDFPEYCNWNELIRK